MKTLLHLGGAPSQVPAIQYAVEAGYKVITCDYLPGNPGHEYSHEYYNVSTTDVENVYQLARSLNIDGIASYASDPAAPTVGYVAEKLGLPGPGEKAARILADKGLFRKMMKASGMRTPDYHLFDTPKDAIDYLTHQDQMLMIKPVDSSGSKGIFRYSGKGNVDEVVRQAFEFSRKNEIIVEAHIPSDTTQIQGEGFVVSGELIFALFGDQKLSAFTPTVPASTSFPSRHSSQEIELFREMVMKAIEGSGFRNGGLNIEIIQDTEGGFHLLELGPRNGGNFMPQLVKRSTGIDLVRLCIDNAMGEKIDLAPINKVLPYTQLILHSSATGTFRSLEYKHGLKNHIIDEYIYKQEGDPVQAYRGSQDVIGVGILDVQSIGKPGEQYLDINEWVKICLEN